MSRIQAFVVLIMLGSTLLTFFYAILSVETPHVHHLGQNWHMSGHRTRHPNGGVRARPPKRESLSEPAPTAAASTLKELKEMTPQSGAYWNRLLHWALKSLEENAARLRVPWSRCRETNRDFLHTNVDDFGSYPDLFQTFLESMTCRSPPALIQQPTKCTPDMEGSDQTFLLFAIKSTPGNFAQRQVVRETWGREGVYAGGATVRRLFLLGSFSRDDPDLNLLLKDEAEQFGDLLQWDFYESFLNLTLKMSTFLEWARESCPHPSFVFSGDDDVFVNTPLVLSYLQSLNSSKASQLYVGHIISSASPNRDSKNKYYIPVSFYDGAYPQYAGGGGYIFSGALLEPLYSLSLVVPFFPIDDVYIGMCFKALGISPQAHGGFQTFDVKLKDRENLCIHKGLMLVHQRTPQQNKKLWRGIHSPLLTC